MSSTTAPKRFRIAFSFAGEKRDYVAKVAKLLADIFGEDKILYDKYHEAEFANADLAFELPDYYKQNADLVVTVFCTDYENKDWCGLEWRAIFSMIKERRTKDILLSRFDFVSEKGLQGLEGFIELGDKTPEEFVRLILQRLALNEGKPKNHYSKASTSVNSVSHTSIPNNLPRIQPFFGREEELKKIADALEPDNRSWGALIDGPGGMGKTSLSIRAAHEVSPDVFDRIIFVSLKSREMDDDGERYLDNFLIGSLAELFNELARELERDDIIKATEAERARMLLDALRGTKTLLILDNLESLLKSDRDVIFNFVKRLPQGCKAILTSRGRIGSGAEELILEQLDEPAALETLEELAKHNPTLAKTTIEERKKLYIETGGKPLLLRWTAGQIGRGHCITIDDAISYLRSCPENNDPLEFIFGDLVEEFTPEETKILCALSYFTMPAKVKHIADIAECAEDITDKALRSLTNRSLAIPNEERSTYMLIPLVADFISKKKPEIIKHTEETLKNLIYKLILKNGYHNYERFPILNEAWPVIQASIPSFLKGDNEKLQLVCDALSNFLNFSGYWDVWQALSIDAEKRAIEENDLLSAGWRSYYGGWVYRLRNQVDLLLESALRTESHWQKANVGPKEQAIAIGFRGKGYELAKDYPKAIEAFSQSLEILRTVESTIVDIPIRLNDLATTKLKMGLIEDAEEHFKEALQIAKEHNQFEILANITGNLAALEIDRKNFSKAEDLARQALIICEQIGRLELIGLSCTTLGKALLFQKQTTEAKQHLSRAIIIYTQLGSFRLNSALKAFALCQKLEDSDESI